MPQCNPHPQSGRPFKTKIKTTSVDSATADANVTSLTPCVRALSAHLLARSQLTSDHLVYRAKEPELGLIHVLTRWQHAERLSFNDPRLRWLPSRCLSRCLRSTRSPLCVDLPLPRIPPLQQFRFRQQRVSSRAYCSWPTRCSTTRPSTPRRMTAPMPPASHHTGAVLSRTATSVRCTLRSG